MSLKSRGKILREKNKLLEWSSTVSIESPDLRLLFDEIASYLEQKSSCQIAVSDREGTLALMGPDRELRLYSLEDGELTLKLKVKVLGDSLPEWCILQWTQSQTLLVSTRSSAVIDIFDANGSYCYSIKECSTAESRFQPSSVISHMQTTPTSDGNDASKYPETLYVMQFDSTFSAFKLGRLSGYEPLFSVNLGLQLCTSFFFSSSNHILLVTSRYRLEDNFSDSTVIDPTSMGINAFRVIDSEPFVADFRAMRPNTSEWRDWIPFLAKKVAVVSTTSVNPNETLLAAVTSVGDLFIFSLPAMRVTTAVCAFQIDPMYRPTQVCWMNDQEMCVMTKSGVSISESHNTICQSLSNRNSTDLFSAGASIFSAKDVIFTLEAFSTVDSKVPESSTVMAKEDKAWLAARLGLTTLYGYVKVLFDMAAGQPAEEVKNAAVDLHSRFILHEMRNITFDDSLQQKLRKREYDQALQLSMEFGEDADIIYKQMWIDRPSNYSPAFIMKSLKNITDTSFVFNECCSNPNRSATIQKILLELLQSLEDRVDHAERCTIAHYKRVWDIFMSSEEPNVDSYLHYKNKSLLHIAYSVSQDFDAELLQRLLTKNFRVLEPYLMRIISLIPESINPRSYEVFLPHNTSRPFENILNNSESHNGYDYLESNDDECVASLNFEISEDFELEELAPEKWFEQRVFMVDRDSGNVDIMGRLIEVGIDRGFTKLRELLTEVGFYRDLVLFCGTVSMSLESFAVTPLKQIIILLGKHLTEMDVCANIGRLVALFEHFKKQGRTEDVSADVVDLVALFSSRSLKLLEIVREQYRKYISEDALVRCFCLFESTGAPLISKAKRLGIASDLIAVLEIFSEHSFNPRFEQLHKSLDSEVLSEQTITQFFSAARTSTTDDWIRLRDDAFKVRKLVYEEILDRSTILRLLAMKMLHLGNEKDDYSSTNCPIDVVLSFNPKAVSENKLGAAESIAVLIDLSRDFWNCAQPDVNDPNLRRARKVLEIVPENFMTSHLREYIRQLDVVDWALRLGCTKLPVVIRLADPLELLTECVQINSNYKQVKACADLGALLGIPNNKAVAMELCAEQALKAHDEKILAKYVERLVVSAKGLRNIYNVCIDILKSPYLKNMRNELISCALLNCPPDELALTLKLVDEIHELEVAEQSSSTSSDEENDLADGSIVCDAMYSSPELYFRYRPGEQKKEPVKYSKNLPRLARRYLHQSVTVAASIMAQAGDQSRPWTDNYEVLRYSQALNQAVEAGVPVRVIESLTVNSTVKAFLKEDRSNATPLERIINSGCDRSRFMEDPKYRMESLIGLAMTNDELELDDCIQVAQKFSHPLWPIYASFVEHLLTDSGMDLPDIAAVFAKKPEMIESCHKGNASSWHNMLRTTVATSIDLNSIEWLRLYVSLFGKDQPEGAFSRVLEQMIAFLPSSAVVDWQGLFAGRVDCLETVVVAMALHTEHVGRVVHIMKQLPNGTVACEDASKRLLGKTLQNSTDRQKCETLQKCFELLEHDASGVMELLAALDEKTEKRFVDEVLGVWESNSETDDLRRLLQDKQRVLLTPTPPYASEFAESSHGFQDFSFFNTGANESSTTMRRRC
ncbi:hypothetical protein QR680_013370 [Steinernema hermaphroditum]|uniref:Sec39 domain-containing protein n=1 Tax=Steinernema hermaphroditum TaxID=289476 RepID=A0AA39I5B2_9BILA|nr:hypothetical protein QR680_013370 [Steinernema hermaphroditum]